MTVTRPTFAESVSAEHARALLRSMADDSAPLPFSLCSDTEMICCAALVTSEPRSSREAAEAALNLYLSEVGR